MDNTNMLLHEPFKKKQSYFQFIWMVFFLACAVFVFSFMFWVINHT